MASFILGISSFYHDSAAVLLKNGDIVAAVQEERFTRLKNEASFPSNAISYCLDFAGKELDDLDAVVFYDKPFLKMERLLETYYAFVPKGFSSFLHSMPVWIKEKLFTKKIIGDELKKLGKGKKIPSIHFTEHHLSHAASTFYPSPYQESAILTIDGVGEWATASIAYGKDNTINKLKELRFPHSLGLLYSSMTQFLGFKVNSGEYKMMGLAPYGNAESRRVKKHVDALKSNVVTIYEDGSLWMDQSYFSYATGIRMINQVKWEKLFDLSLRKENEAIGQEHADLALAIQILTEEVVLKMAKTAKELTQSDNLCLAGGVALNSVVNGKLYNSGLFKNVFVIPASGDAGGALGAAYCGHYLTNKAERKTDGKTDQLKGSFLGPEISNEDVKHFIRKHELDHTYFQQFDDLCTHVAMILDKGNVIGWARGRMEFGPRALGARSIIADPRKGDMQNVINTKIKFRESFRPFAPAVLAEAASDYFEFEGNSDYMLNVQQVAQSKLKEVPANYTDLSMKEKLDVFKSQIPAVTHVDFSARIQTVSSSNNPDFYLLIKAFEKRTDCPMVVNTSFNVNKEPIVCTAADAYNCFMNTDMDVLVLNNYVITK